MITAIVNFPAPEGATSESMAKAFSETAPLYEGLAGLVRKYYLYDPESGTAGGVYLWESRDAAEAVYNDEWRARLTAKYGSAPSVRYFESPVIVPTEIE